LLIRADGVKELRGYEDGKVISTTQGLIPSYVRGSTVEDAAAINDFEAWWFSAGFINLPS
jgi:hypothetical protein